MRTPTEAAIRSEALSIWEASGRPIWSHPLDYWTEAIQRLGDQNDVSAEPTAPGIDDPQARQEAIKRCR
jgi:hypothetical protein